jgi:hypothetical protein
MDASLGVQPQKLVFYNGSAVKQTLHETITNRKLKKILRVAMFRMQA